MSAESQALTDSVVKLKDQTAQIIAVVTKGQTDLVAANEKIAELIAAGATDAELAAATRAAQPDIVQVVNDLDDVTPDGTPTVG